MQKMTIKEQYLKLKAENDRAEEKFNREKIIKNILYAMYQKNGLTLGQLLDGFKDR